MQDGCDVRSGEDRAELERELVGVGAGREFTSGVRLAGGVGQELAPLLLIEGDAVAYWSVPAAHFGRCGDEEACGQLIRLDSAVEPTTFRCATVSQDELVTLRSIENVVRLGRVTRIGPDQIQLANGSVPTDRGQVHVDCSAAGLRTKPARPLFNGGLITLQQIRACQPAFSAALTGYVEATRDDDAQQNLLCPANRYPDAAADWIPLTRGALRAAGAGKEGTEPAKAGSVVGCKLRDRSPLLTG